MRMDNNTSNKIVKKTSGSEVRYTIKYIVTYIKRTLICTMTGLSAATQTIYASGDVSDVMAPLNSLKTLIVAIIGAVGVIILAKNVMEFAQSYQQQDSSTMNSAIKGIVAGLLMSAISAVLAFLGF